MRISFEVCVLVFGFVAIQVYGKSIPRNGRELSNNGAEPNAIPVDIIQPALVIKEQVLVPVENLPREDPNENVEDNEADVIEGLADEVDDQVAEEEPAQSQEAESAADDYRPSQNQPAQQDPEPIKGELIPSAAILKQGTSTTPRPSLLEQAQQIINNNPFGQFIDSIRRPSTRAPEAGEAGAATAEATTSIPNIFQQLQAGVQNIGSQITSALIPPQTALQGAESNPSETVVRPPNFFEQLQTNIQNTVQGIFRPNQESVATGGNQPQGPFQAVLSNVQSFLTGNRGEVNAAQTSSTGTPQKPVDDKVDFNKNSGEVQADQEVAASEPIAYVEEIIQPALDVAQVQNDQPQEEAVVLVTEDSSSSLENESE